MNLNKEVVDISYKYKTPFLIFDLNILRENYKKIKNSVKDVEVFYAIKANDNDNIIKALVKEGSSFDVASEGELEQLKKFKVSPERIICFHPIKSPGFLKALFEYGVQRLAFDSIQEVDKIAEYAPGSSLILRLQVDNEGSDWPLTKKFGVQANEALALFDYAKKKKLSVAGLNFHVGSQCLNKNNWASALYVCKEIFVNSKKSGFNLSMISLGGGMPVKHKKSIPTIGEIGEVINTVFQKDFADLGDIKLTIEPGRALVGDAAIMASSVIGLAKRGNEDWIYLDAGVFHGLMETIENFSYELETEGKTKKKKTVTIAGPSCDSVDVMFKNFLLPEVSVGDKVYIMNAGAYTTVYASKFNAFDVPKIYFMNGIHE